MMFGNIIYFITVLLIYVTYQPSEGGGRQLSIGKFEIIRCGLGGHRFQIIGAHLVTEATGAGVNEEGDTPLLEAEHLSDFRGEHLVDISDF